MFPLLARGPFTFCLPGPATPPAMSRPPAWGAVSTRTAVCHIRRNLLAFACAIPILCLAPAPASAQVFEAVGARALGMGGAFVGVADDGTATYWNPAGLATGATVDVCAAHGREERFPGGRGAAPAGEGGGGTSFCLAVPAIGLSYNHLSVRRADPADSSTGVDPGSRQDHRLRGVGVSSLTTGHYGLTLVQTVLPGVVVGATLKAVRGTAADGAVAAGTTAPDAVKAARDLEGRASTTVDADVGLMAGGGPVRVGLTIRNLRRPSFETPSGERLGLARQARVGVAWTPGGDAAVNIADPRGLILALDADLTRTATAVGERRQIAFGAERWWLGRRLGLRAGARASTIGAARPVAAAGVSVSVRRGVFLEAAGTRGHRDGDRGWIIGLRAGL